MLHGGKLIILKAIFQNVYFISIIIVPTSFCRKYSAIIMLVPQAVTWENIKLYFVSVYGFLAWLTKECQLMG